MENLRATVSSIFGLALVSSCGSPEPPSDTARLSPVQREELEAAIPGHFIDEQPYPCDSGPLIIYRDGNFIQKNGFSDVKGTFKILSGKIDFDGYMGKQQQNFRINFWKDNSGKYYYRYDDIQGPYRILTLRKIEDLRGMPLCS